MDAMECPICLEPFSETNPPKGPSLAGRPSDCRHCICKRCGNRNYETSDPPFACPVGRRDYTQWFVDEFHWPMLLTKEQLRGIVERAWPQIEASGNADLMQAALRILHEG